MWINLFAIFSYNFCPSDNNLIHEMASKQVHKFRALYFLLLIYFKPPKKGKVKSLNPFVPLPLILLWCLLFPFNTASHGNFSAIAPPTSLPSTLINPSCRRPSVHHSSAAVLLLLTTTMNGYAAMVVLIAAAKWQNLIFLRRIKVAFVEDRALEENIT